MRTVSAHPGSSVASCSHACLPTQIFTQEDKYGYECGHLNRDTLYPGKWQRGTQIPQNQRAIWLLTLPIVYLYKVPLYWRLMAGNINSKG